MDESDELKPVPIYQGSVFMKVSRLTNSKNETSTDPSIQTKPTVVVQSQANEFPMPTVVQNQEQIKVPPAKPPKVAIEKAKSETLLKFDENLSSRKFITQFFLR